MERLVAVEIVKDECQSCMRPMGIGGSSGRFVTAELKEIFADLLSDELDDGLICDGCNDNLLAFQQFKKDVQACRLGTRAQADIKEEPDDVEFVTYPVEDIDVKAFESSDQDVKIKTTARKSAAKINKGTKIDRLLKKYNVKFVENDNGRPTKSPKVICPICQRVVAKLSLPIHLQSHEGSREKLFMCEICSKKCISNAELVVHRRRHTKEKPFNCDLCSKRFNCKKNLIQHLRSIHLNQRKAKSAVEQCPICLKTFSRDYLIHSHLKNSHPDGITDGITVDPENGNFTCETCGGQYRTRRILDNHVCLIGANDGPTQSLCAVCSKICQSRQDSIKHIQEEHAERLEGNRWRCLVCDTIVLDKIVLHIESVHTILGSKCNFCNKELKNRRCLRNHIFLMHQNGSEIRKQKRKAKKAKSFQA